MQSSHAPCVERPRVAFRVGVSGATSFNPAIGVRAHVAEVLNEVRDEVHRCAKLQSVQLVYDVTQPAQLRVISPLAEGADRLVAEEAIRCGF
jgi:hypothetical protein